MKRALTLAAALVLLAACGGRPAAAPSVVSAPLLVSLLVGGIEQPLVPGERVPLSGDLVAQLTLRPGGDASAAKVLEVSLSRGGAPVAGATVRANGHMRYMDHGAFTVASIADADGRYLVQLPFAMAGEWEVDLAISTDGATVAVPLALSVIR